jgi:hypothetical protein
MDLQLLDTLTESQLYRSNAMGKALKSDSVAQLLFLNTLALTLMIQDRAQFKFAKEYASKTTNYGNYLMFRNAATDLYTLAHHVKYPNSKSLKLQDNKKGEDYLNSLRFDDKTHWKMIQRISRGDKNLINILNPYLMRLETQLRVPTRLKSLRREITDWSSMSQNKRERTVAKLYDEMRRTGKTGELLRSIGTMNSYKQFDNPEKSSVLKRAATTIAGAAAGAALGSKAGVKLNKDPDKYKKAGAGIGALAGYWAGKQ